MAASNVHAAVQVNITYELRRLTNYRVYTELSKRMVKAWNSLSSDIKTLRNLCLML